MCSWRWWRQCDWDCSGDGDVAGDGNNDGVVRGDATNGGAVGDDSNNDGDVGGDCNVDAGCGNAWHRKELLKSGLNAKTLPQSAKR